MATRQDGGPGVFRPRLVAGGGGPAPKYDQAEFLVGGRGTGPGETSKFTFKVHEGYLAEGERLMRSGLFPYKSFSDMARHAFVRHVTWLQSLEPEEIAGSVLHQLSQIDEIVAEEEFNIRFMANIEATEKMVRRLRKFPNSREHTGKVLRRCYGKIRRMKEGFWKTMYEAMFRESFAEQLSDGLVLVRIEGKEEEGDEQGRGQDRGQDEGQDQGQEGD